MRTYIKDKIKEDYPCKNCEVGSGSYSYGKDEKGEFIETTSCKDDCFKYAMYKNRL